MQLSVELRNKKIKSTAILRTARKLFDGLVFPDQNNLKAS